MPEVGQVLLVPGFPASAFPPERPSGHAACSALSFPDAQSHPPQLFLIDGYALIYRAFFAMISRPLRTTKGENTSAAWGVVNFLLRLREKYRPDYVCWVNDAGTSFREERYPDYKSTREKLDDSLQADFDRAVERICALLEALPDSARGHSGLRGGRCHRHPGPGRRRRAGSSSVIVSGDKDFYQLIGPGIILLNPGRGGPAAVDEVWVDESNAAERLGVPPAPGGGLPRAGGRHLGQHPRREGHRREGGPEAARRVRRSRDHPGPRRRGHRQAYPRGAARPGRCGAAVQGARHHPARRAGRAGRRRSRAAGAGSGSADPDPDRARVLLAGEAAGRAGAAAAAGRPGAAAGAAARSTDHRPGAEPPHRRRLRAKPAEEADAADGRRAARPPPPSRRPPPTGSRSMPARPSRSSSSTTPTTCRRWWSGSAPRRSWGSTRRPARSSPTTPIWSGSRWPPARPRCGTSRSATARPPASWPRPRGGQEPAAASPTSRSRRWSRCWRTPPSPRPAHNIKYDWQVLRRAGVELAGRGVRLHARELRPRPRPPVACHRHALPGALRPHHADLRRRGRQGEGRDPVRRGADRGGRRLLRRRQRHRAGAARLSSPRRCARWRWSRCSATSRCRSCRCWPTWSGTASRSIPRSSRG